jgi:hypothetical protein
MDYFKGMFGQENMNFMQIFVVVDQFGHAN